MDKHEENLKNLLSNLPASPEMPENLRNRALNYAIEVNRKTMMARRPRAVAWMSAGLAALAVGTFFMMPKQATAKAWTMVTQAVEKITSVQMDIKLSGAKEGPKRIQIATKANEFIVDAAGESVIYFNGEDLQIYDSKQNEITKLKLPVEATTFMPDLASEISGAFNLKKEIADMEKKYGKDHIRVMPIRQFNGRDVYDVQMTEPDGPGKAFLTIDAATDLPVHIDASGDKDDENVVIDLWYNGDVRIAPNFPANAKIKSMDMSNIKGDFPKGKDFEKMFEGMGEAFEKGFK
ncbi:MAG TPA: hypothetical protein VJ835_06320 [Fimbriimonadaceae bacterium]|nr:hypothetical protein [Fimbriimonadaceae bacterium]